MQLGTIIDFMGSIHHPAKKLSRLEKDPIPDKYKPKMVNAPEGSIESSYFEGGEEISIVCLPPKKRSFFCQKSCPKRSFVAKKAAKNIAKTIVCCKKKAAKNNLLSKTKRFLPQMIVCLPKNVAKICLPSFH